MWRMHGWTGLQLLCLALVYLVKHFKTSSLGFPFALMLVAVFRLFAIPKIYKPAEIQAVRDSNPCSVGHSVRLFH